MNAPLARVVHSIPGRARLRAPELKGDAAALEALRAALEAAPAVREVSVAVLTGSLVVEHDGSIDDITAELASRGALRLETELSEPYLTQLHRALDESDERLRQATNGRIDLETLSFIGFLAGGVYQAFNHHALPAGVTLLRYAVELVTTSALDRTRAALERRPASPP